MPLGASYLTNGQLAFIKEWILGGAPKEGIVEKAKESLLDDTTRYDPPEFMAIDTPEQGIQLHLGPFEISPQFEREFYYFQPLDTLETYILSGLNSPCGPVAIILLLIHSLNLFPHGLG